MNLSVSLLHLVYWLLRTLQASIEAIEKSKPLQQPGRPNSAHRKVNVKNFEVSLELLKYLTEKEFCLALLFIGRAEEKELHAKVLTKSKMVRMRYLFLIDLVWEKTSGLRFYVLFFFSK